MVWPSQAIGREPSRLIPDDHPSGSVALETLDKTAHSGPFYEKRWWRDKGVYGTPQREPLSRIFHDTVEA
jgi:hypothetical protein